MIVLNGHYNFAKVFLPNDRDEVEGTGYKYLDATTADQIISFLEHPGFRGRKIRIMPDTHAGKGSCVGFTMDLGDVVIPNIIGVDIGCGIMASKLPINLMTSEDFSNLDKFIRENIPSGFSIRNKPSEYANDIYMEVYGQLADSLDVDRERVFKSLGTLGGGNHFIEVGRDTEGYYWLTIHSGSRNLGLQVAKWYQKLADEMCKKYYVDYGDLNFLPVSIGPAEDYIDDMKVAQQYAHDNRQIMTATILEQFFGVHPEEQIDSVHNYINFDDGIVRKGATSAHAGERLVIPFNMEDGLIIGTGKGNSDWNFSAPHGAGRILSRSAAKRTLDLEVAKRGMENMGIFTTSLSKDTLDEAKLAYKPMDLIINAIEDTVSVDTVVRPVYNFKAGGD